VIAAQNKMLINNSLFGSSTGIAKGNLDQVTLVILLDFHCLWDKKILKDQLPHMKKDSKLKVPTHLDSAYELAQVSIIVEI
jgi:hypothetical protein